MLDCFHITIPVEHNNLLPPGSLGDIVYNSHDCNGRHFFSHTYSFPLNPIPAQYIVIRFIDNKQVSLLSGNAWKI